VDLVQIAERLEDESVHAAGEQARYLAREQRLGLLARGGPKGSIRTPSGPIAPTMLACRGRRRRAARCR